MKILLPLVDKNLIPLSFLTSGQFLKSFLLLWVRLSLIKILFSLEKPKSCDVMFLEDLLGSIKFLANIPALKFHNNGRWKQSSFSVRFHFTRKTMVRWYILFFLKLTPIFRPSSPTISFVSSRVSLEIFGIPRISKQSRLEYRLSALNDYFKAFNWFVVPRNSAFRLLFSLTSSVIPLVGWHFCC